MIQRCEDCQHIMLDSSEDARDKLRFAKCKKKRKPNAEEDRCLSYVSDTFRYKPSYYFCQSLRNAPACHDYEEKK